MSMLRNLFNTKNALGPKSLETTGLISNYETQQVQRLRTGPVKATSGDYVNSLMCKQNITLGLQVVTFKFVSHDNHSYHVWRILQKAFIFKIYCQQALDLYSIEKNVPGNYSKYFDNVDLLPSETGS